MCVEVLLGATVSNTFSLLIIPRTPGARPELHFAVSLENS